MGLFDKKLLDEGAEQVCRPGKERVAGGECGGCGTICVGLAFGVCEGQIGESFRHAACHGRELRVKAEVGLRYRCAVDIVCPVLYYASF